MSRDMRTSYEAGAAVGMTTRLPDGETFANVLFHEEGCGHRGALDTDSTGTD